MVVKAWVVVAVARAVECSRTSSSMARTVSGDPISVPAPATAALLVMVTQLWSPALATQVLLLGRN